MPNNWGITGGLTFKHRFGKLRIFKKRPI